MCLGCMVTQGAPMRRPYEDVLCDILRNDIFEGQEEELKLYCARRARQNL